MLRWFIIILLFCWFNISAANANISETKTYVFFVDVTIDSLNNQVVISWEDDEQSRGYYIKRKLKEDAEFGFEYYAELPADDTEFIDTDVKGGVSYEYSLEKWCGNYSAWNYINVAWGMPITEYRGRLLLLVDSAINIPLADEIDRLIYDITGDGWLVVKRLAPRREQFDGNAVQQTKQIILDEFANHQDSLTAVFLLGRIAVPYSGVFTIDGHHPEHYGAWPADVFYAELDHQWKDVAQSNTDASDPRQHNLPGDGKFDHSYLHSDVDLQLGRVDLFNLPYFEESEIELLRNYLDKNHKYRHKINKFEQNAVIDDKFGMYSNEAFAANAWMNYSALLEKSNIDTASIRTHLTQNRYLFSYGCNSGGTTSCYLVGYSSEFPNNPPLSAFYTAFGSWFGDWDVENNLLRAALASKETIVASFWSGRPFWHLHHLGLGENIGYSAKITQNNLLCYETTSKYGNRYIHINLLGDPTLRIHTIAPPSNLEILYDGMINLRWQESEDDILGYYVYRSESINHKFSRISELITTNSFTDNTPLFGNNLYQIRAVKKEYTQTGSYYNMSQAIFAEYFHPQHIISDGIKMQAFPNPARNFANILVYSNEEINADLSIYDLSGKKVATVHNGMLSEGLNVFLYSLDSDDGKKIAKSIYNIILHTSKGQQTFLLAVD